MRNVAPTRSLTRRANQWKSIAFFVGAFGAFLVAIGVLMNVIQLVGVNDPAPAEALCRQRHPPSLGQ